MPAVHARSESAGVDAALSADGVSSSHARYLPANSRSDLSDFAESGRSRTARGENEPSDCGSAATSGSVAATGSGAPAGLRIVTFRLAVPFHDDMRVRPGYSERADASPPRAARCKWPIRCLCNHPDRQPLPVQMRVRGLEVQVLRDHAVTHGQNHLDQPGDPRGRLEMTDVGLDGADQQLAVLGACRAVDCRRSLHLDRIA